MLVITVRLKAGAYARLLAFYEQKGLRLNSRAQLIVTALEDYSRLLEEKGLVGPEPTTTQALEMLAEHGFVPGERSRKALLHELAAESSEPELNRLLEELEQEPNSETQT